ncbi:MAG: dihydroorotate dehydrogenase electron transfer subunit, partial [Coriobacteriia bacterium]|nr:dihydroorotate dehydrogenase electron transfer subunit [Coriobacteriia bacterium]
GNRWPVADNLQHALLVGGGIGAAPLALLAAELAAKGCQVTMLQAARTANLLLATELFAANCSSHVLATDDGSAGQQCLITTPLADLLASSKTRFDAVYICGPEPMQEACAQLCLAAGLPTWVSLERLMACGVGVCLTCVLPTAEGLRRVCADGPIFAAEEVDWHEARRSRVH